jgi:choline dehydrogenase
MWDMRPLLVFCFAAALADTTYHATIKRQTSQIFDTYDFIIAGGGTTGLTVADRLSAAFPNSRMIELLLTHSY